MGPVFVSYSRRDRDYVAGLVGHLRAAGIDTWFDDQIPTGERWDHTIRARIDDCAAFILVMSPDADASTWVGEEIDRARRMEKPILPLLLSGEVFFGFSRTQYDSVVGGILPPPGFVERLRELIPVAAAPSVGASAASLAPPDPPPPAPEPEPGPVGLGRFGVPTQFLAPDPATVVGPAEREASGPSTLSDAFGLIGPGRWRTFVGLAAGALGWLADLVVFVIARSHGMKLYDHQNDPAGTLAYNLIAVLGAVITIDAAAVLFLLATKRERPISFAIIVIVSDVIGLGLANL